MSRFISFVQTSRSCDEREESENPCLKRDSNTRPAQPLKAKSRKYQGVFEVKGRAKTWQVRGIWSQQLEHPASPKMGDGTRCPEG